MSASRALNKDFRGIPAWLRGPVVMPVLNQDMDIAIDDDLRISALMPQYARELFELTDKNRDYLKQWLPWVDSMKSAQDTEAFIEAVSQKYKNDSVPHFAIFYKEVICGVAGYHDISVMHRAGSIGYWLSQGCQGNGIVTRVVEELLRIGFYELGLNKVEIRCAEENTKSRAIPERLGFKYEGTLRQCEWLYTRFVNHAVYSLLAAEFDV